MQTQMMKKRLCTAPAVLCILSLAACSMSGVPGTTEVSDAASSEVTGGQSGSSGWEAVPDSASGTDNAADSTLPASSSDDSNEQQISSFQSDLCEFSGYTYLAIADAFYCHPSGANAGNDGSSVSTSGLAELCSCYRARGIVSGDYMYWAIIDPDTYQIRIVKYGADGSSDEKVTLDGSSGLGWLDCYDGSLILKDALNGVCGWTLDENGDLQNEIDASTLSFYTEEQAANASV